MIRLSRKVVKRTMTSILTCMLMWPLLGATEVFNLPNGHELHVNALTTNMVPAEVARRHQIKRSTSMGMLNVALLKQGKPGELAQPVPAELHIEARNLVGTHRAVEIRTIQEQDAIYYLVLNRIRHLETLRYSIQVKANDMPEPVTVRFDQEYFVD